jgi:hypothetical protein
MNAVRSGRRFDRVSAMRNDSEPTVKVVRVAVVWNI